MKLQSKLEKSKKNIVREQTKNIESKVVNSDLFQLFTNAVEVVKR
jgi:hypothetical protein